MAVMAASTAQPCRRSPTISPNVQHDAAAMSRIESISRKFESDVGFSSGWAELALKKPPPLVPSCLMAICEAAGPSGIDCSLTSRVFTTGLPSDPSLDVGFPSAPSTGLFDASVTNTGSSYDSGCVSVTV